MMPAINLRWASFVDAGSLRRCDHPLRNGSGIEAHLIYARVATTSVYFKIMRKMALIIACIARPFPPYALAVMAHCSSPPHKGRREEAAGRITNDGAAVHLPSPSLCSRLFDWVSFRMRELGDKIGLPTTTPTAINRTTRTGTPPTNHAQIGVRGHPLFARHSPPLLGAIGNMPELPHLGRCDE